MNKPLKQSVKILRELHNSLEEITSAGKVAYKNFNSDRSIENGTIMNCVYAVLIIRASAFLDEIETGFEKIEKANSKELKAAISHYKNLFRLYRFRKLRNYVAHNRKKVGTKGKKYTYKYITDADIAKFKNLSSPAMFESLSIGASRIIDAIDQLGNKRIATKGARRVNSINSGTLKKPG